MDETRKKTEHVYSKETRRRNPFLGFLTIAITLCLASALISPGSGVEAAAGSIETRPVVTSIWQPTPPPWGPPQQ